MPAAWAVVATLGLVLAILLTLILTMRRIFKGIEDKQKAEDALKQMEANLARSEAARKKEREIADATRKVREEPGPTVPDLGGVRDGPRR